MLWCAVNPTRLQRGHPRKTRREALRGHMRAGSELARRDPARLQRPREAPEHGLPEQTRARIVSSGLMSSGTAPAPPSSFQTGLDSCPSSRSWAGWVCTGVSLRGTRAAGTAVLTQGSTPTEERRGKEQKTPAQAFYKLSCKRIYTLLQINPEVPFFSVLVLQRVQV